MSVSIDRVLLLTWIAILALGTIMVASASVAISEKQAQWRQRIAEADSQKKQAELRDQANKEIKGTIEDKGLSPQEYSRIHRSAQQDDGLYEELMTRIKAERSD